ncbi:MAG: glutathione S-transferase family protein [Solirubrobacteraceae bacterium]
MRRRAAKAGDADPGPLAGDGPESDPRVRRHLVRRLACSGHSGSFAERPARYKSPTAITSTGGDRLPVLWQLELSHYNEKVRWALDLKRIPHVRRSLLPGVHVAVTSRLSGGTVRTTPMLTLDGRVVGDSTRIIQLLERRWPEPALYPADPEHRARALELEEFFDEQLGPHIRRAVYFVLLDHPDVVMPLFMHGQRLPARLLLRGMFPILKPLMRDRMEIEPEAAELSRELTFAAMDCLERELGPSGYLVGDSFTIADLTAAALFYPVVLPPEFPYPLATEVPPAGREVIESLAARPGARWVADVYARHRHPAA